MSKVQFSEAEASKILAESFDRTKVLLHCEPHRYVGSSTPPASKGCKNCWEAWYWYMLATTPPHLRQERLEQLEAAVHYAVEAVEAGTWDLQLYDRPQIKTERVTDEQLALLEQEN